MKGPTDVTSPKYSLPFYKRHQVCSEARSHRRHLPPQRIVTPMKQAKAVNAKKCGKMNPVETNNVSSIQGKRIRATVPSYSG